MSRKSRRRRPEPMDFDEGEDPRETAEYGAPNRLIVGLDCRSMNPYRFLRVRFPAIDRAVLQSWIAEGRVSVNDQPLEDANPLRHGDVVEIDADVEQAGRRVRPLRLQILFEDAAMIAVDKPAGLATAPERHRKRPDLLTTLKQRVQPAGDWAPKLVHRIDKHASGVVVFARDRAAKRQLIEEFAARRVTKDYLCLVSGHFPDEPLVEESPLAALSGTPTRMIVAARRGKASRTLLRVRIRFRGYSVVHARPHTGRTHQIRVHLRHLGHTIVGDALYSGEGSLWVSRLKSNYRRARGEIEKPLLDRLALHAARIELKSPATGQPVICAAALPRDLVATFRQLQKHAGLVSKQEFAAFEEDPLGLQAGGDPFGNLDLADLEPEPVPEEEDEQE